MVDYIPRTALNGTTSSNVENHGGFRQLEVQERCRIPTKIGQMVVSGKSLVGGTPFKTGQLLKLKRLDLHNKRVCESIPSDIADEDSSIVKSITFNSHPFLNGPLPSELDLVKKIEVLNLKWNA